MFGRRRANPASDGDLDDDQPSGPGEEPTASQAGPRATGPWDAGEIEIDEGDESRVDLGSLMVAPQDGLDVQLQVDEASGQVAAVFLSGEDGAAELRAFAAPRHGDIWDDVRRGLAGEVAQMGGTATERRGPFGPEVVVSVMVTLPDGQQAQQDSVVVGISGPRWLLRVTLFGRPAAAWDDQGAVETAIRGTVVVRGGSPIPPGDPLPLVVPPGAQRA